MQCDKLRSIMGSYLNIHLSLSLVYVLLLLLTLSHGRPSARIREPFGFSVSNNYYYPSSNVNYNSSIDKSSDSNLMSRYYNKNQGSNGWGKDDTGREKKATGSWSWKDLDSLKSGSDVINLVHNNGMGIRRKISSFGMTPFNLNSPGLGLKLQEDNNLLMEDIDDKDSNRRNNNIPTLLDGQRNHPEGERELSFEEIEEEESEDQEQLDKFRKNILKELGFDQSDTDNIKRVLRSTTSRYPSNIPSSNITPKLNISREEYLEAYTQYMFNVRQRKEKARVNLGPRSRRKNAATFVQTYYDNGTDHPVAEGGVLTTYSFSIKTEELSATREGVVRIRKALLSLPASCSLNNGIGKYAGMSGNGSTSSNGWNDEDKTILYDLTEEVTSWIFHADSSPFVVMASCSQKSSSLSTATGMSSLKIMSSEISVGRSRRKRSAQKSTLQNFKNNGGGGRDCSKTRRGKTCCRRSLKVKFADLGISDVIIEPHEFDAHVCVGRCNAKRVAYSTTHAMFQHILHQTKGKKFAPRPCCTPTKLTELDVIHLDPTGTKLQVTVLKDAIVEECGCS